MQPISIPYAYNFGKTLKQLDTLQEGVKLKDVFYALYGAEQALTELLGVSVYSATLKTCQASGNQLVAAIKAITAQTDKERELDFFDVWSVSNALAQFEAVYTAEMNTTDVFLVTKTGGYNTADLLWRGELNFPLELAAKVPEAITDVQQACRCMAFGLPTAAGFHLHRANESVLHRYYDAVTNGTARPTSRNMGDYLKVLNDTNAGEAKVRSALKDLKDLHRNPIVHPEDSLESVEEASALLGSIHAVMLHMLKAIPTPAPIGALQAGGALGPQN